ncbi:Uncharacterised protein [uncultured archaeon]|nr:Uncharacterised protein [uncultured archaeon]
MATKQKIFQGLIVGAALAAGVCLTSHKAAENRFMHRGLPSEGILRDSAGAKPDTLYSKTADFARIVSVLGMKPEDIAKIRDFDTLASGDYGQNLIWRLLLNISAKRLPQDSVQKQAVESFLKFSKIREDFYCKYRRLEAKSGGSANELAVLGNATKAFAYAMRKGRIAFGSPLAPAMKAVCFSSAQMFMQLGKEVGLDLVYVSVKRDSNDAHGLVGMRQNGIVTRHVETTALLWNSMVGESVYTLGEWMKLYPYISFEYLGENDSRQMPLILRVACASSEKMLKKE